MYILSHLKTNGSCWNFQITQQRTYDNVEDWYKSETDISEVNGERLNLKRKKKVAESCKTPSNSSTTLKNAKWNSSYLVRRVIVGPKALGKFGMEFHVLGVKVFHQLVLCGICDNQIKSAVHIEGSTYIRFQADPLLNHDTTYNAFPIKSYVPGDTDLTSSLTRFRKSNGLSSNNWMMKKQTCKDNNKNREKRINKP